ncbi:hypothetical protein [Actinomycetospora straminea]|uniref:Uncharacterized protein n=1 Tax=Actinomycetospora straminea TaxID=663607 RepID=A0ABP9FA15_9PSEU|nr:hypothetical protein [Actinomycetospora straminea]MDD7936350.1 hypothetical protein [Actinomycetospora straminea]
MCLATLVAGSVVAALSLVTTAGVPTEGAFVLVMLLGAGAAVVALVIVAFVPRQRPPPRVAEPVGDRAVPAPLSV